MVVSGRLDDQRDVPFGTSVSINGDAAGTTVSIEGVLDAVTVPEVRKSLDALMAQNPHRVVVDLSHLRIIDSCGVGAIVSLYKRVRANSAELTVSGASQQPLAVLKLLNLDRMFDPTKNG
jgi:anti-sigma B factor antagonist